MPPKPVLAVPNLQEANETGITSNEDDDQQLLGE
jgi:hypothetical protein